MLKEATVTNVTNDNGIIVLRVEMSDGTSKAGIAFGKIGSDFVVGPQEGDVVAIGRTDGDRWVAHSIISKTQEQSPNVGNGDFAFQLNPSTSIKAMKNSNGNYDITIECDGSVTIDSAADIFVGSNGEQVAKQNHTHNDSSGGQTTTPNESGTNTKIE